VQDLLIIKFKNNVVVVKLRLEISLASKWVEKFIVYGL
jgi:hypothetical protein